MIIKRLEYGTCSDDIKCQICSYINTCYNINEMALIQYIYYAEAKTDIGYMEGFPGAQWRQSISGGTCCVPTTHIISTIHAGKASMTKMSNLFHFQSVTCIQRHKLCHKYIWNLAPIPKAAKHSWQHKMYHIWSMIVLNVFLDELQKKIYFTSYNTFGKSGAFEQNLLGKFKKRK